MSDLDLVTFLKNIKGSGEMVRVFIGEGQSYNGRINEVGTDCLVMEQVGVSEKGVCIPFTAIRSIAIMPHHTS